jgi:8-oxo-dGTP diphosphatase
VTTVVAAIIERDGRILITQRKNIGYHPLKWEFPGGKVEPGETPQAALVRELHEELGIAARIDRELIRYEYEYSGRSRILLIFYRVLDFDGVPQNLDFEQILWERADQLRDYDFLEGDKRFIGQFAGLPANTISPPEA